MLRTAANDISVQGRITQGVRVMDLRGSDTVASVAVVREGRLSQVNGHDEETDEVVPEEGETAVSAESSS